MMGAFLPSAKWRAFQSTAILRLPTPRKPPKSMIAARHLPALIDDHIDDPPHILSGAAADLPAQHRIVLFDTVVVTSAGAQPPVSSREVSAAWATRCNGALRG